MARSPVPRLFLLLLSALALGLIGMENAAAAAPTGWLDSASCTSVNGWACDPDISGPINVHIYVDGVFKTSVLANDAGEAAIGPFCGGTTAHRWHWNVQPSQYFGLGLHNVNAYPIGVDSGGNPNGENPELQGSPKSPTCTGEWHCCDLRAVNPPGLWYPDPPVCALIGSDCILDPGLYCQYGSGSYQARSYWPSPPDAIQQIDPKSYWCIAPFNHSSMDPGASGAVTPCNESTHCSANGTCYKSGYVLFDADGDGDNDYCLNKWWYDCLTDTQCLSGFNCSGNNCIPNIEINENSTPEGCIDSEDNDGDGLIDEDDPDCCSWCEAGIGWEFDGLGTCTGASDFGWEDPIHQQTYCCGNNATTEFYESCVNSSEIFWGGSCTASGPTIDDMCCNATSCVDSAGTSCYDASRAYDIPESGKDSFSYCNAGGVWQDCDNSSGICGGCAGVAGFPCTNGTGCWAKGGESAAFGEYNTGTATECCGDDLGEYFNRSIYHASIESPPPTTTACCNATTDCVNGSACYTTGATADVDSNSENDICSAGTWKDCTLDAHCGGGLCCNAANNCSTCTNEAGKCADGIDNDGDGFFDYDDPDCCAECEFLYQFDSTSPSTPPGCGSPFSMWELGGGFQQQWCCGNNLTTEFNKTGYGFEACCNATTDCVDGNGVCRIGSEYSPGGCTDDFDHDCDGLNNFDDENCRATIYGNVTDDGTPAKPIENAIVTAVATDPMTGRVVQYSNVTNVLGNYLMNVTKGLDYDIVVVVPGYGTGFVWNHWPGNINFKIKKAENCEDDCTSPGENWCRPECWGLGPTNGCKFSDTIAAHVCDGAQKDWILPFSSTQDIQCCDGAPVTRKRTQVVGVSGAESVVRVTRIISYGGQLITLVIDVFK